MYFVKVDGVCKSAVFLPRFCRDFEKSETKRNMNHNQTDDELFFKNLSFLCLFSNYKHFRLLDAMYK